MKLGECLLKVIVSRDNLREGRICRGFRQSRSRVTKTSRGHFGKNTYFLLLSLPPLILLLCSTTINNSYRHEFWYTIISNKVN